MNGLFVLAVAIVTLATAYLVYGRYLVNKWGVDPNAETPAYTRGDGVDFVPSNKWEVFAHQFSSIAGAGPVTGPVIAMMFGWVPAFLWILVGGVFFGAVQDFGALYASVKSQGKSLGQLIETYIGKTAKKLFFLFCWLFSIIVIAAFADMVAGTFNGFNAEGVALKPNAAASSISMIYIAGAILFGFVCKKFKLSGIKEVALGVAMIVAMLALGIAFPMYATKQIWLYVVFVYIFFASVTPISLLKQPRDYLTTFLFLGMIVAAVVGVLVANPTISAPAFTGFVAPNGSKMFPVLFITIACGAVSGFHSLVSSETSSKQIANEKDMLQVGYGSMLLESLLGILVIVIVGSLASLADKGVLDSALSSMAFAETATPFTKFSVGVTGLVSVLGLPQEIGLCVMTMFVSALALTSLDAVARIGRLSLQGLLEGDSTSKVNSVLCNKYVATVVTLAIGFVLALGGYQNIWPLFGATNQLLAAMVLITISVFLKVTGRQGWMLYVPMGFMLVVTLTSLITSIYAICMKLFVTGGFMIMTDGLQLFFAVLLVALGLMISCKSIHKLTEGSSESEATNQVLVK